MKQLCNFYIKHAGLIGVIYCAVPNIIWFAVAFFAIPFREVYLLRLGISLIVGCPIAAFLNRHGVDIWLIKHRSANGPATVLDGILIGAAIGIGSALLPTLTVLISSSNLDRAKTIIILTYLSVTFIGGVFGLIIARIAQKYIDAT